jgi:NRAMP (natural resistance-associated macrophage protein)-like metal ion transporter
MKEVKTKIKGFFRKLGPGFISGAADDDPTAIATYTQAGAQFGYGQLWTALFTFPFMVVIQEMCGRIGMVTGKGLAGVIRKHYSDWFLAGAVILLLVANTINIGADLGAMAAAGELLFDVPFIFWLIGFTVVILILEIFLSYRVYSYYLKYLTLTLLTYLAVAILVNQDWGEVFKNTFFPSFIFSEAFFLSLIAILGTNISPYLFFWQAGEEVEEAVADGKLRIMGQGTPKVTKKDILALKQDTTLGMLFSNIVVFSICLAAAGTLGKNGLTSITTPAEAAKALEPLVGSWASVLFALGIIGSGLLAVPVLSGSASYAITESFGWKEGFYRRFSKAHGFYGVITVATLVGLLINFLSIPPFQMLIYAAAINGLLAPPLLILILFIANNKEVMGKYTNTWRSNLFGVAIILLLMGAAGFFLWHLPFASLIK